MTVKTGQVIVGQFVTRDADGYLKNADALPTGTLVVAGANDAAVVTIANVSTGVYSRSVTLPALTAGQTAQVRIAYTLDTVTSGGIVWQDMADTLLVSDIGARLGSWTGTLRNTVLGAMQALFRKDADATVPSDVNANLGGGVGAANNTTDSAEAIRDRGDAAWITATGFATSGALTTHDGKLDTVDSNVDAILADTGTDGVVLKAAGLATDAVTEIAAGVRGTGSSTHVVTVTDGTNPLDGVVVVISTDTAGSNKVASGTTGTLGTVTFYLDPGTYYAWMQLSGYNFSNPGTVTVV